MRIDELVAAINRACDLLTFAEEAQCAERDKLLQQAAAVVCQAFAEAVDERDLESDLASLHNQSDDARLQAQRLLRERSAEFVRAEGRFLRRLGIKPNIVEGLELELRVALQRPGQKPPLTNTVFRVKEVVCALRDQLRGEAQRERRQKRIWGGVMTLTGVVIAAAGAPFVLTAPPFGIAMGTAGAALAAEGLNRVTRP